MQAIIKVFVLLTLLSQVYAFLASKPVGLSNIKTSPASKLFSRTAIILKPTLVIQASDKIQLDDSAKDALLAEFSKTIASKLGKPESYVFISFAQTSISFGGSRDPAAFLYLTSIGKIGPDYNPEVAAALSDLVEKHLDIPPSRVFIQFVDSSPSNFGFNGRTFG